MQTKDLKAGRFYAYKYASWATPERVKVLDPKVVNHKTKQRRPFGGTETVRKTGVLVEFKGGKTDVVKPATLGKTWADHQRDTKAQKAYEAEAAAEQANQMRQDAVTVVALDALLRERGAKVHGGAYCYDEEMQVALRDAGMPKAGYDDTMDPEYAMEQAESPNHFSSVFYSLHDAMDGKFDLDVLALLVQDPYPGSDAHHPFGKVV